MVMVCEMDQDQDQKEEREGEEHHCERCLHGDVCNVHILETHPCSCRSCMDLTNFSASSSEIPPRSKDGSSVRNGIEDELEEEAAAAADALEPLFCCAVVAVAVVGPVGVSAGTSSIDGCIKGLSVSLLLVTSMR